MPERPDFSRMIEEEIVGETERGKIGARMINVANKRAEFEKLLKKSTSPREVEMYEQQIERLNQEEHNLHQEYDLDAPGSRLSLDADEFKRMADEGDRLAKEFFEKGDFQNRMAEFFTNQIAVLERALEELPPKEKGKRIMMLDELHRERMQTLVEFGEGKRTKEDLLGTLADIEARLEAAYARGEK